jgi:hypothetical protein
VAQLEEWGMSQPRLNSDTGFVSGFLTIQYRTADLKSSYPLDLLDTAPTRQLLYAKFTRRRTPFGKIADRATRSSVEILYTFVCFASGADGFCNNYKGISRWHVACFLTSSSGRVRR